MLLSVFFRPVSGGQVDDHVGVGGIFELLQFIVAACRVGIRVTFSSESRETDLRGVFKTGRPFFFSIPGYRSCVSFQLLSDNGGYPYCLRCDKCAKYVVVNSIVGLISIRD